MKPDRNIYIALAVLIVVGLLSLLVPWKCSAQITDTVTIDLSAGAVKAMIDQHGTAYRQRLRSVMRDAGRREVESAKTAYKSRWGNLVFDADAVDLLTTAERNYFKKTQDSILARLARIEAARIEAARIQAEAEAAAAEQKRIADSAAAAQPVGDLMTPEMLNDTCANDPFFTEKPEQFAANVGKAYSPRQEFLAGVGDSYNHGYPESWGWIYFVLYEVPKYIVYTIVGYGVFLLGHYLAHEMFEWK